MCFNRRVLIGLGLVALGVLVVAPGAFSRVLPLLVVAACPLSMLLMMRGMSGTGGSCQTGKATRGAADGTDEIGRLRSEIAQLRAERSEADGGAAGRDRSAGSRPSAERPTVRNL